MNSQHVDRIQRKAPFSSALLSLSFGNASDELHDGSLRTPKAACQASDVDLARAERVPGVEYAACIPTLEILLHAAFDLSFLLLPAWLQPGRYRYL